MTQRACDVKITTHLRVVQGCQNVGLELIRLSKTKLSNIQEDIEKGVCICVGTDGLCMRKK